MQKLFLFLFILFIAIGCVPKEKILYVQDLERDAKFSQAETYQVKIKPDDLIRIVVTSENMDAVAPFNKMVSPTMRNDQVIGGQQQIFAYLVDQKGIIDFPILGELKVNSRSVTDLTKLLRRRISEYVTDPVFVDVRILNFKVTILGEVSAPGTYSLESNRNTLLQALGRAGDLTIYGNRKDIIIIRENADTKLSTKIDITSADFINSEFYFLEQNDVIIVNPNNAQIQSAGFNRNAPLFVSIASLLLSIIVIIERN